MSPRASQRVFLTALGVAYAFLVSIALLALSFANVTHPGLYAVAFLWPWLVSRYPHALKYLVPLVAISYAYRTSVVSYQLAITFAAGIY